MQNNFLQYIHTSESNNLNILMRSMRTSETTTEQIQHTVTKCF